LIVKIFDLEKLRCSHCRRIFTAELPEEAGRQKYHASAASTIALMKYGTGVPFHRTEKLQRAAKVPLEASTQWEVVFEAALKLAPVYMEHLRQGAQAEIFYNDDTKARILSLMSGHEEAGAGAESGAKSKERTGIYTSGVVCEVKGRQIALFFTGRNHAGENLAKVLEKRSRELPPPIQMCDGLERNIPKGFETVLANCNAHARRKYVELTEIFPEECRYVLETLKKVYHNDALAEERGMSPEERLAFHKEHSTPLMEDLKSWLETQIEEKRVEPNSALGEAIGYMQKRWDRLTLFLEVPGAPIDNNTVERSLKFVIRHRKNSLFYRTENGAWVGDVFMTLIYNAVLHGENPFDYLTQLQLHAEEVRLNPSGWLPWNYRETLERIEAAREKPP
jgi:hypothetical protein